MQARSYAFFIVCLLLLPGLLPAQGVETPLKSGNTAKVPFAEHSVLSSGYWTRWAIPESGVYKISYEQLAASGLSLPVASSQIRVYGNGGAMLDEDNAHSRPDDLQEIAIRVADHGDGLLNSENDYILFYAEGPVQWTYDSLTARYSHQINLYSDYSYVFIGLVPGSGKRMQTLAVVSGPADTCISTFQDLRYHEMEELNLLKSGKLWFGEKFNSQLNYSFDYNFPELDTAVAVRFYASIAARSMDTSYMKMDLWNFSASALIDQVYANVNTEYVKFAYPQYRVKPLSEDLHLSFDYIQADQNSTAYLDYFELVAERQIKYHNQALIFRNAASLRHPRTEYRIHNYNASLLLWNISDPQNVVAVNPEVLGDSAEFLQASTGLQTYVLFDSSQSLQAEFIEETANQDLHAESYPDMVIVTPPDLEIQAERLADFHRNQDDLEVNVVQLQQIYNEFASGKQDPAAIRDYMHMLYVRSGGDTSLLPRYLLLFGDGSYDYKNRIAGNTNIIPAWQTWNSVLPTSSFVSDDFYGLMDDGEGPNANGSIDIGIGRFPVSTPAEAKIMVDKVIRYNSSTDLLPPSSSPAPEIVSNFGDWRNTITFIADDEDGNLHFNQAEILAGIVDSLTEDFNIHKIYLDAYQQQHTSLGPRYPGAHDEMNEQVRKGSLIVNYTGHGGETGLAEERILEISDIDAWTNYFNLPVFITATCEFSRYDNPQEGSAGEHMLLNSSGGAVAMYSTTRVAFAHTNMIINTNLLNVAFENPGRRTLGDIVRIAKSRCGSTVYMQNFTLLGDPAMHLAIPNHKVYLTRLNGNPLQSADSMVAGTSVELEGYVGTEDGDLLSNFNGEAICTVFDKPQTVTTLANDFSSTAAPFEVQQAVIYKGRARVTAGQFSFSFTVPKDVAFNEGNARLSIYAKAIDDDATGSCNDLRLQASTDCGSGNGSGPDIRLFINDRGFIENGITGSDVKVIADIKDADGINFFGAGIGHDITMVVDHDFNTPMVMNDYFMPALNRSDSGSVYFNLNDLEEGPHTLYLKAWDVLNFSSEKELSFIVKKYSDLSLNHVVVFPNPMSSQLNICFDRNVSSGKEWLYFQVKSLDGRLLWIHEEVINAADDIHQCNVWDGRDVNGNVLPSGLYIYTLQLTDESGDQKQWTGKISKVE